MPLVPATTSANEQQQTVFASTDHSCSHTAHVNHAHAHSSLFSVFTPLMTRQGQRPTIYASRSVCHPCRRPWRPRGWALSRMLPHRYKDGTARSVQAIPGDTTAVNWTLGQTDKKSQSDTRRYHSRELDIKPDRQEESQRAACSVCVH